MKTLIAALMLLALTTLADEPKAPRQKTIPVTVAVPDATKYYTRDTNGVIELWSRKAFIYAVDGGGEFWSSPDGIVLGRIVGGVPPKNWKRSQRRVR